MKNGFKYGDATEKIHGISMSKVVVLIVYCYVTNYPKSSDFNNDKFLLSYKFFYSGILCWVDLHQGFSGTCSLAVDYIATVSWWWCWRG